LFHLGDRHGPSPADSVGLAVVLGGQLVYLHALWSRRRNLRPRWAAYVLGCGAVAAVAGCIAAFAANQDGWAYALAGAAFAAQLALGLTARNG
jgi:peptidoglycan/LPS O-acetylase OafA/YrhL